MFYSREDELAGWGGAASDRWLGDSEVLLVASGGQAGWGFWRNRLSSDEGNDLTVGAGRSWTGHLGGRCAALLLWLLHGGGWPDSVGAWWGLRGVDGRHPSYTGRSEVRES